MAIRTELPAEPDPVLSGGMGETLDGLTGLTVTVTRVDVVHRTAKDDPATESLITIDDTERTFTLAGDLQDQAARNLGFFTIPVGFVFQLRFVVTSASITVRGDTYPVKIPSGEQSGLKIEPLDGEPFEIKKNERTAGRIVFNPFEKVIRNYGEGFKLKPVLPAEHVTLADISNGMIMDEVIVRFENGTSQTDIDAAIAAKGATVLARWAATNYYRLKLPADVSLKNALEYYNDHSDVRYVLPNTLMAYDQNDPQYPNQTQWPQVSLGVTYGTGVTGDYAPVLAVVDSGVFYDHPDLINNIFINVGELPAVLAGDASPVDGFMDADFDQDGFITFADLNAGGLTPWQIAILTAAGLVQPITPTDLLNAVSDGVDDDDFDGDPDTFIDDVIGWDFGDDDNTPLPDFAGQGVWAGHGTWVAGVAGAVGNNATDVTGTTWNVRIMPVRAYSVPVAFGDRVETSVLRDSVYRSILYADAMGADVINVSLGGYVIREGAGNCSQVGVYDLDSDKYDEFAARLDLELADLHNQRTTSLVVTSAGNCGINLDSGGVYVWPKEVSSPSLVVVAGVDAADGLSAFSNFGGAGTHVAAPAEDFIMLDAGAGAGNQDTCVGVAGDCDGTSYASPMVAGVAALLISQVPALQGNPCNIADRIIRNGDAIPALVNVVGPNGFRLNAIDAINNVNPVPVRGCP